MEFHDSMYNIREIHNVIRGAQMPERVFPLQ